MSGKTMQRIEVPLEFAKDHDGKMSDGTLLPSSLEELETKKSACIKLATEKGWRITPASNGKLAVWSLDGTVQLYWNG